MKPQCYCTMFTGPGYRFSPALTQNVKFS